METVIGISARGGNFWHRMRFLVKLNDKYLEQSTILGLYRNFPRKIVWPRSFPLPLFKVQLACWWLHIPSQLTPLYPTGQRHSYPAPPMDSMQVPPFAHGSCKHLLCVTIRMKVNQGNLWPITQHITELILDKLTNKLSEKNILGTEVKVSLIDKLNVEKIPRRKGQSNVFSNYGLSFKTIPII